MDRRPFFIPLRNPLDFVKIPKGFRRRKSDEIVKEGDYELDYTSQVMWHLFPESGKPVSNRFIIASLGEGGVSF
jgi:hypothetical protein